MRETRPPDGCCGARYCDYGKAREALALEKEVRDVALQPQPREIVRRKRGHLARTSAGDTRSPQTAASRSSELIAAATSPLFLPWTADAPIHLT
jgi:hypothetical protein